MFELSKPGEIASGTRVFLAVAWAAAVAPLLTLGYGSDVDSWLVGERALQMWATGTYARSRSTGFPLYEITVTPLVAAGGWVASNALSLAAGLAVLLLIYRLADDRTLQRPATTILTLVALPVFVKNATSTMDYVPALALLLAGYVALNRRRPLWAAALVGVACGVRPTSGLFIIPMTGAVLVESGNLRTAFRMGAIAVVVGHCRSFHHSGWVPSASHRSRERSTALSTGCGCSASPKRSCCCVRCARSSSRRGRVSLRAQTVRFWCFTG